MGCICEKEGRKIYINTDEEVRCEKCGEIIEVVWDE